LVLQSQLVEEALGLWLLVEDFLAALNQMMKQQRGNDSSHRARKETPKQQSEPEGCLDLNTEDTVVEYLTTGTEQKVGSP
jgi:hypothetical protein